MLAVWLSLPLRLLLFCIGLAAAVLPRRLELALAWALGRFAYHLRLFRYKTVRTNIEHCFPEWSAEKRQALMRDTYEHLGNLFFEYAHLFSPIPGHYRAYMQRHVIIEGRENWERAAAKGKGVIFVASHLGWWEMLAAGGAMSGIPLTIVTTVLKPPWLHDLFTRRRLSTEVRPAFHPGSLSKIIKAIRKGESTAFMNDQYARPPMGMPVKFFGVEVDTLSAVGPLAKRTGAAVVPVYSYRDADGKHHVVIEPEMDMSPAEGDPKRETQMCAARVEAHVRKHPQQWLWIHRRFKHVGWY